MDDPIADLLANAEEVKVEQGESDIFVHKPESELIDDFIKELAKRRLGLATCYASLDSLTDGLHPGVTVIAAPPGAGKTTFCKQLADQVAEYEQSPVLFFSFEQSAAELRIKSLARMSGCRNDRLQDVAKEMSSDD